MGIKERYEAYVEAFELIVADEDWSRLDAYFTEDAVHVAGGNDVVGLEAIKAFLSASVAGLDRKMDRDTRDVKVTVTSVEGDTVTSAFRGRMTKAGLPDFTIEGTETAIFRGDRMVRLATELTPASVEFLNDWMAKYGTKL